MGFNVGDMIIDNDDDVWTYQSDGAWKGSGAYSATSFKELNDPVDGYPPLRIDGHSVPSNDAIAILNSLRDPNGGWMTGGVNVQNILEAASNAGIDLDAPVFKTPLTEITLGVDEVHALLALADNGSVWPGTTDSAVINKIKARLDA